MLKLHHVQVRVRPHHIFWAETLLSLFFSIIVFNPLASAADVVRFQYRSLLMNTPNPGVLADYTLSFMYTSEVDVGSIDLLFCTSPIPTDPCHPPLNQDVSPATLLSQTGETGYSLTVLSPNHMQLRRTVPATVSAVQSTYVFHNIKNSTDLKRPFSIRLADYASTDGSGRAIDIGSVVGGQNNGIMLETQVPPMLLFCVGQKVSPDCGDVTGGNYTDLGTLSDEAPLTAQSQMAAGTNASRGYTITVNGLTMAAGNHIIDALSVPSASIPGKNQFGINLTANTDPLVGSDSDGDATAASATDDYSQPNMFKFHDGDIVADSPNVSLLHRFTVSYLVNTKPDLPAGVYSTTLSYICSGRF